MSDVIEEKSLSNLLKERSEERNISISKIAEVIDVPERYIKALVNGDFSVLPPAPYIHGYLIKISEILEIDGKELWQKYKKEISLQSSGPHDRLPMNRFAIPSVEKKWIGIFLCLMGLAGFLIFRLPTILGQPSITLAEYREDKAFEVASPIIVLSGSIKPGDKLTVNEEAAYVDEEGKFNKEVRLQEGLNTVEMVVQRFLGGEKKIVKQFIYEQKESPAGQQNAIFP